VPAHVFVYPFDEHGIVRDRVDQRVKVDPARASSAMRENGIKYFATLALPPGHYAIRALVALPCPQKRGFVRTDLVVPEPGNPSVSPPLFFDKPGQWALLKGQRVAASYPFLLDGEPFVPSATPLLQPAARTEFALFLYNATAEEMMIRATVTDSAGAKRIVEPTLARQIQGDRVTKLIFELNPAGMSPGPATLDLALHKKGSSDSPGETSHDVRIKRDGRALELARISHTLIATLSNRAPSPPRFCGEKVAEGRMRGRLTSRQRCRIGAAQLLTPTGPSR
jgi:hypothetical protein